MADEKGEKVGAGAGKKRPGYYISDEMIQVVKDHAARGGLSESAAAEDLLQRGAVAASAQSTGAQAVPAIAAAVGRTVEEVLRAVVVQPFGAELAAIHHEATLARLEGFAHLGNDYGPDMAERIEAAAEERAKAARAAGEVARLTIRVTEEQVA
jgi:hypothetical protein